MSSRPPETIELYGGKVVMEYDDGRHCYRVNGEKIPSVTQITSVVSKGDALTNWAANEAAKLFREGVVADTSYDQMYLDMLAERAKGAHRAQKAEAADIGTQAHRLIEAELRGKEAPYEPDERAVRCYEAAKAWMADNQVVPLSVERRVYSRKFGYSGTTDEVARVGGLYAIVDWKSSKGLYPEHLLQTAAYAYAVGEEDGRQPSHRWLVRLGKDDGSFEAHHFGPAAQKADFAAFVAALTLYKRLKILEAAMRRGKRRGETTVQSGGG